MKCKGKQICNGNIFYKEAVGYSKYYRCVSSDSVEIINTAKGQHNGPSRVENGLGQGMLNRFRNGVGSNRTGSAKKYTYSPSFTHFFQNILFHFNKSFFFLKKNQQHRYPIFPFKHAFFSSIISKRHSKKCQIYDLLNDFFTNKFYRENNMKTR